MAENDTINTMSSIQRMLTNAIRVTLSVNDNNIDRDFVNNKKQRYKIKKDDEMKLDVLIALGIYMDELIIMIKESKIECWNQFIINSGITKENIITILSQKYDEIVSPDGKNYRNEDMQRVMSLYPYNIRLTDLGGYFEKMNDDIVETEQPKRHFDHIIICMKFQELLQTLKGSENKDIGETISIFVPSFSEQRDIYFNIQILDDLMFVRILFDKTNTSEGLIKFMTLLGSFENEWLKLTVLIHNTCSLTKCFVEWFRKQEINLTSESECVDLDLDSTYVGNSDILTYYHRILKLLVNISMNGNDYHLPKLATMDKFSVNYEKDAWFLKPAEGKHIPRIDSDIENETNKINNYIYHNHILDNIYRLDAGLTNYGKFIRWHICFNDQIIEKSDIGMRLISEHMKTKYSSMSFGNTVHDNQITRSLIDFLAHGPITQKHKYVLDTLDKLWD